jgi:hypothetical protein
MNNEQIKLKINLLTEQRKMFESFLLPIFTGLILAMISQNFLGNLLYLCLFSFGVIVIIFIAKSIIKLNKQINLLINQIS